MPRPHLQLGNLVAQLLLRCRRLAQLARQLSSARLLGLQRRLQRCSCCRRLLAQLQRAVEMQPGAVAVSESKSRAQRGWQ